MRDERADEAGAGLATMSLIEWAEWFEDGMVGRRDRQLDADLRRHIAAVIAAAERRRQAIINHDELGTVMFDTQSGYAAWLRSGDAIKQAEKDLDAALAALTAHLRGNTGVTP